MRIDQRRLLAARPCAGLPALSGVWGNPPHLMSGRKGWGRTFSPMTCDLAVGLLKAIGNLIPRPAAALWRLAAAEVRESPAGFGERGVVGGVVFPHPRPLEP